MSDTKIIYDDEGNIIEAVESFPRTPDTPYREIRTCVEYDASLNITRVVSHVSVNEYDMAEIWLRKEISQSLPGLYSGR